MKKIFYIIIIFVVVLTGVLFFTFKNKTSAPVISDLEKSCVASGGTVQESNCCKLVSDFPNTCAIGACGCSSENSKITKVCACPNSGCWDGSKCSVRSY